MNRYDAALVSLFRAGVLRLDGGEPVIDPLDDPDRREAARSVLLDLVRLLEAETLAAKRSERRRSRNLRRRETILADARRLLVKVPELSNNLEALAASAQTMELEP